MAMPGTSQNAVSRQGVRLTPTEIRVLSLIAQGFSSQDAADNLVVSKRTVDFHLANVYQKLQVRNRVQAIRSASQLGLIPNDPMQGASGNEA
jgi:ATP/maltotriose-dependent transcriptional regulator MalT